jgi:hypothetical protein
VGPVFSVFWDAWPWPPVRTFHYLLLIKLLFIIFFCYSFYFKTEPPVGRIQKLKSEFSFSCLVIEANCK